MSKELYGIVGLFAFGLLVSGCAPSGTSSGLSGSRDTLSVVDSVEVLESDVEEAREETDWDRKGFLGRPRVVVALGVDRCVPYRVEEETGAIVYDEGASTVEGRDSLRIAFDAQGNVMESVEWSCSEEEYVYLVQEVYSRDEHGRLVSVHTMVDSQPKNSGWLEYSYDDQGRKVRTVLVDAWGDTVKVERHVYDAQGREVELIRVNGDGEESGRERFSYDRSDRKIRHEEYDADRSLMYLREYRYDERGNCVWESYSSLLPYDRREEVKSRTFDGKGRCIVEEVCQAQPSGDTVRRTVRYERNHQGKVLKMEERVIEGESMELKSTEYVYDSRGGCLQEETQYRRGNRLISYQTKNELDDRGNWVRSVVRQWSGGVCYEDRWERVIEYY